MRHLMFDPHPSPKPVDAARSKATPARAPRVDLSQGDECDFEHRLDKLAHGTTTHAPKPHANSERKTKQKRPSLRLFMARKRRVAVGLLLIACATPYLLRFTLTIVGERYLAATFHGEAAIEGLRIGLREVSLRHLQIHSGRARTPMVDVDEVHVPLRLMRFLTGGRWIGNVRVARPTIQLEFDTQGQLKNQLPQTDPSSESEPLTQLKLPIESITIEHARLVVHQDERKSIDVDHVDFKLLHHESQILALLKIPTLLGGSAKLSATIDPTNLETRTQLSVRQVGLSTRDPLALCNFPASLNDVNVRCSLQVDQAGVLSDLLHNQVVLRVEDLSIDQQDQTLLRAELTGRFEAGEVTADLHAKTLDGTLTFESQASAASDGVLQLSGSLQARRLSSKAIPKGLLPSNVSARFDADSDFHVQIDVDDELLKIESQTSVASYDTHLDELNFAPTSATVNVQGVWDLTSQFAAKTANDGSAASAAPTGRTRGGIEFQVGSHGIRIADLLATLQDTNTTTDLGEASEANETAGSYATDSQPRLAERTGYTAARSARGDIQLAAHGYIPLATVDQPGTYRVHAIVDATDAEAYSLLVREGRLAFHIEDGIARVDARNLELVDMIHQMSIPAELEANVQFWPPHRIQVKASLPQLPLETMQRFAVSPEDLDGLTELTGSLGVELVAGAPVEKVAAADSWEADAQLRLNVAPAPHKNDPLIRMLAVCHIADGVAHLTTSESQFFRGTVGAKGRVELAPPYRHRMTAAVDGFDVERCLTLVPQQAVPAKGTLRVTASGAGQGLADWKYEGQLFISELHVARRNYGDSQLRFTATPHEVRAQTPANAFLGGQLAARLQTPLRPQPHGIHDIDTSAPPQPEWHINANVQGLPIHSLARLAGRSERAEGHLNASFEGKLPAEAIDQSSVAQQLVASLDVSASDVLVDRVRLTELAVAGRLADGTAHVSSNARTLGGEVSLEANTQISALDKWLQTDEPKLQEVPVFGVAKARRVEATEAWRLAGQQTALRPLTAQADVELVREPSDIPASRLCRAELRVDDLRWDRVLWSPRVSAEVDLTPDQIVLRQLRGNFADGQLLGKATMRLDGSQAGSFQLSASRLQLRKLVVPVDRSGRLAEGAISIRVQGKLGHRPRGQATIMLDRAQVANVAMTRVRVPIDWSLNPAAQIATFQTHSATLGMGGGRIVSQAKGRWNGKLDFDATSHIRRVDTSKMMQRGGVSGTGILDGVVRMKARRANDARDMTGSFHMTLSDAKSLQLPVLSDITSFLETLPSTTAFEKSTIDGRIANGIVYVEQATLSAPSAQILIDGNATFQGRLNLNVMAQTGADGPADQILKLADSPLVAAAPTPLAMVAKVNNALKERVVHLHVGGTAASPSVRLEPGKQLGAEAVKFFMNQTIILGKQQHDQRLR